MKTYCKKVDITDVDFIESCILECLHNKWSRYEVHHLLSLYSGKYTKNHIRYLAELDRSKLMPFVRLIAEDMSSSIMNEDIVLPDIRYKTIIDPNNGKERIIGRQAMIHQFYEHVAVNAMREMFDAKIGALQCASIPGRGQSYGKQKIEKWLKNDVPGTKYCVKADIRKCYPSVDQMVLRNLLARDIRKNQLLLKFVYRLLDMFETGLSIGSHLSQWLCNYYISYAYHYVTEQMHIVKKRRGKEQKTRMVKHVLFYMDDMILLGPNKKHLKMAMKKLIEYFQKVLHLQIKDDWRLFLVHYQKDGKNRGSFIDMMGFRFYRGWTTVRQSLFLKARRKFMRFRRRIRKGEYISYQYAATVISYYGWFKNSNSHKFIKKYKVEQLMKAAKKIVGKHAKRKNQLKYAVA